MPNQITSLIIFLGTGFKPNNSQKMLRYNILLLNKKKGELLKIKIVF